MFFNKPGSTHRSIVVEKVFLHDKYSKEQNRSKLNLNLNPPLMFDNESHETTLGIFYNSSKEKFRNDIEEAFKPPKDLETNGKRKKIHEKSTTSHTPAPDYWLIASCILLLALIIIIILILICILCSM